MGGEIFQSPSTGKRYLQTEGGVMQEVKILSSAHTGKTYMSVEGELTEVVLNDNKVEPAPPGAPNVQITGTPVDPYAAQKAYGKLPALNKGVRAAGEFVRGVGDQANAYVGGAMDLSAAATEALGLTGPGQFRENINAGLGVAGEAGTGIATELLGDMGPTNYRSTLDKVARGAGKSTVDTGVFFTPGRALKALGQPIKQAGRTAPAVQRAMTRKGVGTVLNEQKGMQMIAGGTGGAAQELGNGPLTSMGVSMVTPSIAGVVKGAGRKALSPLARSFGSDASKLRKEMTGLAGEYKIPMTTGQITNSKFLQVLESSFAQLPITARHQMALFHEQRMAFNRAVMAKAGMSGDDASPQAIDDAFEALGARYEGLAAQTKVTMDGAAFKELDEIIKDYAGNRLPKDVAAQFKQAVDDINAMRAAAGLGRVGADGRALPTGTEVGPHIPMNDRKVELDGATYQNIVSNLKRTARDSPAPELKRAFNRLASMMDGAMERTAEYTHQAAKIQPSDGKSLVPYSPGNNSHLMPPPTGKELRQDYLDLNRQYRNLLILATAMTKGTQADRTDALVPLGGLMQTVKGFDGVIGYARGKGDMNDLARIGDLLASTNMPDSFTAIRSVVMKMLGGGPAGVLGGGAFLAGADPGTIAVSAAGGLAVPRMAQKAYMSPIVQGYLKNQAVRPGPTPTNNKLLLKVLAAQQQGQTIDDLQEMPR
jgi:hypothetical protein